MMRAPGARRIVAGLRDVVVVVLLVGMVTVLMTRLAGGSPARAILGQRATQEQIDRLNSELGVDRPLWEQVVATLAAYARGDLGASFANPSKTVASIAFEALPATLGIIVLTVIFSLVFGLILGLYGGTRGPFATRATNTVSIILLSFPPFSLALILILTVALGLKLAPAGGWAGSWPDNLTYAWLPALALSGMLLPQIARTVQQRASDLVAEDFIEAAESRGLSQSRIVMRHILPNVLLPVITIVGFNASFLISGAVVVEAVFGVPGFGQVLSDAVAQRDYPVIQGLAMLTAVLVVAVNFFCDVLYTVADPRTRVLT